MQVKLISLGAAVLGLVAAPSVAGTDPFEVQKRQKIAHCAAIPEGDYSTGMIFNAPGFATLFDRAFCFQKLAVDERDPFLCDEVREKKSWIFDGSGVSGPSCRKSVAARLAQDRQEAGSKDFGSIHRLLSVEFLRNGNGTDFDAVVTTAGSYPGAYELTIALAGVSVHKRSYAYGGPNLPRRIFLRRSELAAHLGEDFQEARLTAHVTLRLEKTAHNRFYHDSIPEELQNSRAEVPVRFSALPRWESEEIE